MTRIAVLQTTTGIDPAANAATLVESIGRAKAGGAEMVFTPEMSGLLDRDRARAADKIVPEGEDAVLAAGRQAAAIARKVAVLHGVEMIAAAQGIDYHQPLTTSERLQKLHSSVRAISPRLGADRYWADEMASIQSALLDGECNPLTHLLD